MRERRADADRGASDLERDDRLAARVRPQREFAKARAARQRLDRKPDDLCIGVLDAIVDDIEYIEIGFVAYRDKFRQADAE